MPRGFTGHVRAPNKDHLMALSVRHHGPMLAGLFAAQLPRSWDSRSKGWIGSIKNQSQCGSCWDFSGVFVVETAYNKAGVGGGPNTFVLSEEYVLSCQRNGGCNGDDNVTVLQVAKATGLPLTADYGPYTAKAGTCNYKPSMNLYKVKDWGFVDGSGQGVTDTDKIKAAIMAYGCVGCAVAAVSDHFWDTGTGTGTGRSSNIDHDVGIVAWDDDHDNGDGTKGAWVMRNSWDVSWGLQGYAWVKYGAYDLGTEAVWAMIDAVNPPIDWSNA